MGVLKGKQDYRVLKGLLVFKVIRVRQELKVQESQAFSGLLGLKVLQDQQG
jgi:hypothetical protein